MRTRRGQALMELSVGLLALAIVVSALCGFAIYIVKSLEVQNALRSCSPKMNTTVELGAFAEQYYAGRSKLHINEKWVAPPNWVRK